MLLLSHTFHISVHSIAQWHDLENNVPLMRMDDSVLLEVSNLEFGLCPITWGLEQSQELFDLFSIFLTSNERRYVKPVIYSVISGEM